MKDYDKMFKELYENIFLEVKTKYDAICKIFLDWNTGKIDSKTAYERLKKLMVKRMRKSLIIATILCFIGLIPSAFFDRPYSTIVFFIPWSIGTLFMFVPIILKRWRIKNCKVKEKHGCLLCDDNETCSESEK